MRLACGLLLSAACFGQMLAPIVAGGGSSFTLTATTVGSSQTVTINRLTLNGAQILSWGDGNSTTITSGSTGTWTHVYASAGAHSINLPNARGIVGLDLRDAQLGALNTSQLRQSAVNYFYATAITSSTIKSADMSAWRPATWALYSMPAGTYSISSADMSAWRPATWDLYSMPTGTYSISSADMAAWTGVQNLYTYSNTGGALTINTYTDFTGLVALHNLQLQNNSLAQASVDAVLKGLWTSRASFTYATPSLTINGTNAAPSGIYQSNCPTPATGKEWAYDLVHETCAGAGHAWTVTTN